VEGLPVYANHRETVERHLGYRVARGGEDGVRVDYEVNAHPPTAVLLALPLAVLDYPEATLVWNLVSLGALAVSLRLVARELRVPVSAWSLVPLTTLLLLCNPLRQQVNQGQFNLLLLLLLASTWAADRAGKGTWAGIWLGAATAVKLFPGFLLLYFAVRRQGKVLVSAALTTAALTGLTAAVLGVEAYRGYVEEALPRMEAIRGEWSNASLPGLWTKLFDPATGRTRVTPLRRSPALARTATALSGAIVLIVVAVRARRARTRTEQDWAFGLAVTGMLLVSPVTWDHYFLLLLLPVALLWLGLPSSNLARATLLGVVGVLCMHPGLLWDAWIPGGPRKGTAGPVQTLLVLSPQCYALLALFVLLLMVKRVKRPA
jgi:hypothetical protein